MDPTTQNPNEPQNPTLIDPAAGGGAPVTTPTPPADPNAVPTSTPTPEVPPVPPTGGMGEPPTEVPPTTTTV